MAYASDPEVARYMSFPRHEMIADAHSFLNTIVATNYQSGELDYAITELCSPRTNTAPTDHPIPSGVARVGSAPSPWSPT